MFHKRLSKNIKTLVFLFATFSTLSLGLETLKNDTLPKDPWEDPFKDSPNPLKNPTPGVDSVLFKDTTPREFFTKRLLKKEGQERLKKAFENHQKSLDYLKNYLASKKPEARDEAFLKKVDEEEVKTRTEKEAYLALVEEFGNCTVGKLVEAPPGKIAGLASTEGSIGSDGSCQNLETDLEKLKTSYKKLAAELKNLATYRQHNEKESNLFKGTGTASVLEMSQLELVGEEGKKKLQLARHKTQIPLGEFFPLYIGVKGPEIGALFSVAYYVNNYAREWTDEKGVEHFAFSFSQKEEPAGFNRPGLIEMMYSGRQKTSNAPQKLKYVVGQVYANSEGYFRYSTESVLTGPATILKKFITEQGRKILLDTIVTFSNRTFNEVKQ